MKDCEQDAPENLMMLQGDQVVILLELGEHMYLVSNFSLLVELTRARCSASCCDLDRVGKGRALAGSRGTELQR